MSQFATSCVITFDPDRWLVCSKSIKDHFSHPTVAQHFQACEGRPLAIPAETAGPKPTYPSALRSGGQGLEWHRREVFGR